MEKRLYKIHQGKMLDGVCGGIARYFGWDSTQARLARVLLTGGIAAYLICALGIPRESR